MRYIIFLFGGLWLLSLTLSAPAIAQDKPFSFVSPALTVKVGSKYKVGETLDKLSAALKAKGVTVFTRIDHQKNAEKAGLKLLPTQLLIFGNPKLGTGLINANRTIGLDLPMKALAWQDEEGKVWLSYTNPQALRLRHHIEGQDEAFQKMSGALKNFAAAATGAAAN